MQTAFATEEKIYSVEEYLEMEETSPEKHEFYNGKISLMPGGTFNHNLIATNISTGLNIILEKAQQEKFLVCNSDMKIYIPRVRSVVYPDAVVVFEQPEFYLGRKDVIVNPLLIIEVASPSTARHDRTKKFWHYQSLPSFKEYVIVEQDFPFALAFYKTADHNWTDTEVENIEESIYLKSIDCNLDLKRIYKGVKF